MERHLFQTGQTELHGSLVALNSMQARMRENHASGLIEVRVGASRQIMVVYANGAQAGIYLLENDRSRPFHLAELSTLWGGAPFSVSMVNLPDRAGRAIWMIAESQRRDEFEIHSTAEWNARLEEWKQEKFNGAVEVTSKSLQGFIVLKNGLAADTESVFFNGQGFENQLPPEFDTVETWKVSSYVPPSAVGSWQCFLLRSSAAQWMGAILSRFGSIAGAKFLGVVEKEIESLIQPWRWRISVSGAAVADEHFFPSAESAAHAYRALLMGMGAQMGFVIGSAMTQRILSENFDELIPQERAVLEAYRLIPAAFTH